MPIVTSWLVKALDAVVDVVPVVGEDWVIVLAPAGPSTTLTNANEAIRHEAIPKAILRVQWLCMVKSPVQNAERKLVLWTHLETRFGSNLEAK